MFLTPNTNGVTHYHFKFDSKISFPGGKGPRSEVVAVLQTASGLEPENRALTMQRCDSEHTF